MNRLVDLAPCLVAFVLYTNAAVVGARFHGIPFAIAASYVLLLLVPITRDMVFRNRPPVITPTLLCIVAFFCVGLVGALLADRPDRSMNAYLDLVLEGAVLYVLFLNAIRTPRVLQGVVWTLILAGALMGAAVGLQQATGSFEHEFLGGFAQLDLASRGFKVSDLGGGDAPRQLRLTGPIGEPNRFAQIMAMLVPLAALQIYVSRRTAGKLLAGGALCLILLGGALAFSRGAAVGLGAMVLVMIPMGYAKPRHLVAMVAVLALVAVAVPQYGRRLASLVNVASLAMEGGSSEVLEGADGSTRGRMTQMIAAVFIFADHPVIGAGPDMYPQHYLEYSRLAGGKVRQELREPHSLPLEIASEYGMLGLATFGMALFYTFRDLIRARRRWLRTHPELAHLSAGLLLALVVYLATGVFLHMSYARYFWFVFALAGVAGQLQLQEEHSPLARLVRVGSPRPA